MVHIFQRWKPVCWNMTERLIDSIWRGGVARGDYERKDMIHDLLSRCAAPNFFWGQEEEEASWIIMVKYFVFCFVFFCFLYHPSALIERFEDRKPVLTRLSQIDLNWLSSNSPVLPSGTGLWPVHRGSRRRRYPSKTWIFWGGMLCKF